MYRFEDRHSEKCIAWFAPLISGLAGAAVSAVANTSSTNNVNRTNRDIADANNQLSYRMNAENNAFNATEAQKSRYFNSYEAERQRLWEAEQADLTRQFNSSEAQKTREFNSYEASLQRSFESSEAQKAREWDSPAHQMQLLRQAGINPAMVDMSPLNGNSPMANGVAASSGSSASANTPSGVAASSSPASSVGVPSLSMPTMHAPQLPDLSESILNIAKAKDIAGDTDFKNMTKQLRYQDLANFVGLSTFDLEKLKPQELENLKSQYDLNVANTRKFDSDVHVNNALRDMYDKDGQLKQKEIDVWAEKYVKWIEETDSRIKLNYNEAKLALTRIVEARAHADSLYAQADLFRAQGDLVGAQKLLVEAQEAGQIVNNGIDGMKFQIMYAGHDYSVQLARKSAQAQLSIFPLVEESNRNQEFFYNRYWNYKNDNDLWKVEANLSSISTIVNGLMRTLPTTHVGIKP